MRRHGRSNGGSDNIRLTSVLRELFPDIPLPSTCVPVVIRKLGKVLSAVNKDQM